MPRPLSKLAPAWWDYTTLESDILKDAARLKPRDLAQLSRPGFTVRLFDTVEGFHTAEAREYIDAWKQAAPDNHPRVRFNYLRSAIGSAAVEMH